MCEPFDNYEEPLHGVSSELISGMSSLNMEPEPVKEPKESDWYISELDENVKHAMTHFKKAFDLLIKHNSQEVFIISKLKDFIFKASRQNHNFDLYKELEEFVYKKEKLWDKYSRLICDVVDNNGKHCPDNVFVTIQKGLNKPICLCEKCYLNYCEKLIFNKGSINIRDSY